MPKPNASRIPPDGQAARHRPRRSGGAMKIEHLREYIALAQTLNFSIAAKRLHISQPVLSTHIKSLEAELGFPLFIRDKHSVALSDLGKGLLPEMEEVVERYDRALTVAERLRASLSSKLSVGYLYNAYRDVLPMAAGEFSNRYPDVELRMHSFGYKGVTDALYQGSIDLAFSIDVDEGLHDLCNVMLLGVDPLCCVVRRDDPLAAYDVLSLRELDGESFILPHPGDSGALARFYDTLFEKAGFSPRASMQYHEIDTRYLAIEAGEGIALVGGHFRRAMSDDLKFIPLAEEYCAYDFVALWPKANQNDNVERFLNMVKEHFGTN